MVGKADKLYMYHSLHLHAINAPQQVPTFLFSINFILFQTIMMMMQHDKVLDIFRTQAATLQVQTNSWKDYINYFSGSNTSSDVNISALSNEIKSTNESVVPTLLDCISKIPPNSLIGFSLSTLETTIKEKSKLEFSLLDLKTAFEQQSTYRLEFVNDKIEDLVIQPSAETNAENKAIGSENSSNNSEENQSRSRKSQRNNKKRNPSVEHVNDRRTTRITRAASLKQVTKKSRKTKQTR